jgi:Tir chaperone protein (CesT) family
MVKDLFDSLLEELSLALKISDLHADRNNSCLVQLSNGVKIQLEVEPKSQSFVIGSDLGEMPTGQYRNNLFREALKTNGLPGPHAGILAYSNKTDHLVLFKMLPLKELNGEKIAAIITTFSEKALLWKESIAKGEIPVHDEAHPSAGMFGLRP